MRKLRFILLIFPSLIFLTTCKKYPEGGFTMRGPKMLLKHNGAWKLTLYEVNGIDSTELINYNGDENYKNVSFYKEDTHYNPNLYAANYPHFSYLIKFENDNKLLNFQSYDQSSTKFCYSNNQIYNGCYRLFFCPENKIIDWEIIKLTKTELHLRFSNSKVYNLKFKNR